MEYTINKLAQLAGISTRTLRYYDTFGLLSPVRSSTNGYRLYGQKEVERLQHILFYRELGLPLEEIRAFLLEKDFDGATALQEHLSALLAKRNQLDVLIANVQKTISAVKGEIIMNDEEKFEGFKAKLLEDNDRQHGAEIRAKHGDDIVNASNAKVKGMTKAQYAEVEALTEELNQALKVACEPGDPSSESAQKACALHKDWLCRFWDSYSKEAHIGVAQMYVDDPRFTAYYENIAPGCAVFLRDAILVYCA